MFICATYWSAPKDVSRSGREQVMLVSILPDGETGIIVFNRTFIKVALSELEWARWD